MCRGLQGSSGGGGTYSGFGYLLQNGPRELWLSTQSRLEKRGGCHRPKYSEKRAVKGGLLCGGSRFWLV